MSLHLRKMMQEEIDDCKRRPVLRPLDSLENDLLDRMTEDRPSEQLGSLVVISAELLEHARRSDPAYGLHPVVGGSDAA